MVAESVGKIGLDLVVNKNGFNKQMQGITGLAKKAGAALAGAFAIKKLIDFSKQSINLGSQLAEVDNVIQQAVPSMEKHIDTFAKNTINQFGMSEIAAKRFTGVFASMSRGFGFSEKSAAAMGTTLTSLAADVASFYDTSQDEAFTKLKSVFTGETESLKDLGVVMTQSALDSYALANGYGKTTKSMSEAEKVALRYAFVQEKLRFAQGDFARNSNSWANQVRILSEQFNALKATIGQGLINVLLPVIKVLNTLLSKIQSVATAFSALTAKVFGKAETTASGVAETTAGIGTATEDAVGGIAKAGKEAKKAAKNVSTGIDELNIIDDSSSDSSEGGSGTGGATGVAETYSVAGQEVAKEVDSPMLKVFQEIKKVIDEITASFLNGFIPRFQKIDFSGITTGLKGIGNSLKSIFSDNNVVGAAASFVSTFASAIGANLANFISIGTSIATNIVGAIDTYLSNNTEMIKERFVNMFNNGERLLVLGTQVTDFLAQIGEILRGDLAISITSNLVEIFANGFINSTDLALQFGTDLVEALVNPILNNKSKILDAITGTLEPIEKVVSKIAEFMDGTWKKVYEVYKAYVKPAFDNIESGLTKIVSALLDAYNSHILPVINNLADKFSDFVDNYLVPLRDKFLELAGKVAYTASVIWNEALAPLVAWLIETFGPYVASVVQSISDKFFAFGELVATIITSVIDVLSGILDFIVAVFTGNWGAAWEAIKKIISSIWEGIKKIISQAWDMIKTFISSSLDVIKASISARFNAVKDVITAIWNGIKDFFSIIWDGIKNIVTEKITNLKDKISDIMGAIKSGCKDALDWLKERFGGIFGGIRDTVVGIFQGMWSGIKNIINSILGGIEGMANGVVKGINKVVSAMNNLSFDIPDWVPGLGGKTFGFSIPSLNEITIPKLAQGGYVKANTPQLAMIGDNRHQGEVVAPEDKMVEMIQTALKLNDANRNESEDREFKLTLLTLIKEIIDILSSLDFSVNLDGKRLNEQLENVRARSGFVF